MKVTIAADVGSDVALIKQALEYSGHEVDIRIVDKNFAASEINQLDVSSKQLTN